MAQTTISTMIFHEPHMSDIMINIPGLILKQQILKSRLAVVITFQIIVETLPQI